MFRTHEINPGHSRYLKILNWVTPASLYHTRYGSQAPGIRTWMDSGGINQPTTVSKWEGAKSNWYPGFLPYHSLLRGLFFYCSWYFVCVCWGGGVDDLHSYSLITPELNRRLTLNMNHYLPICPVPGILSASLSPPTVLLWELQQASGIVGFMVCRHPLSYLLLCPSPHEAAVIHEEGRVAHSRCFHDLNLIWANHPLNDVYPVTDL